MQEELLNKLKEITKEEQTILEGSEQIQTELYTAALADPSNFTIDSKKLLEKGRLIEVRPHTRFVHFPNHRHNYVEVVYMCNGNTTHILNHSEKIVLSTGDLLFLSQSAEHEILPAGENDLAVNFIILPEFFDNLVYMIEKENVLRDFFLQTLSRGDSEYNYLHFHVKDILPIQNLLENMVWTIFSGKKGTNAINQTTMGLLLMNISLFTENISQSSPRQTEQGLVFAILKYIDNNYKNGSLSDICMQIKQPEYYISRLLKKHTNKNFKELLQERRLQQATYLLERSTLTNEQILDAIGYDNSSYFYRIFRDKYGCSPKEYRKI